MSLCDLDNASKTARKDAPFNDDDDTTTTVAAAAATTK